MSKLMKQWDDFMPKPIDTTEKELGNGLVQVTRTYRRSKVDPKGVIFPDIVHDGAPIQMEECETADELRISYVERRD